MPEPDLADLRRRAAALVERAYCPYSSFPVAAVALTTDDRIVSGVNVENASYGLTLCAECSLVSDLHTSGGGRLRAVSIVQADGTPVAPCGRCRQLLSEHGGPDLVIDRDPAAVRLADLLPDAFGPGDLTA